MGEGTTLTIRVPFGLAHLQKERVDADSTISPTSVRADAYVEEALQWIADNNLPAGVISGRPQGDLPAALRQGTRILLADDNADMRGYVAASWGRFAKWKPSPMGTLLSTPSAHNVPTWFSPT